VHLSGLTLADQARLFASASHIVAPHGAGLANLIFCNPGVSICELHMKGYLNWCFRRLGGVRGVNYGCIVGAQEPSEHKWPHHQRWSVPLMQVEAALNDRQFMDPMNVRSRSEEMVTTAHLSAALQWRDR
jgi:capsular polysaccharide biosynthesis protein